MTPKLATLAAALLLTVGTAAAVPAIHSVRPVAVSVGRYEKFEAAIDLSATFDNPFDPGQVDLSAEFTAPSGRTLTIWGFYQPSSSTAEWMLRFSPTETGSWTYVVRVKGREGAAVSPAQSFVAVESRHHGFVTVAPNHRYLAFSDGTPFYGVGFWDNDKYESAQGGTISEAELDRFKKIGVNFISFYPTPLETMATGVGRYDLGGCHRLDQLFEWCEARDLEISWNVWFHAYLSETVWGGGSSRYRSNPYRTITAARDFFGSAAAWAKEEQLHRYLIARWGYSRALFLWFLIDEINGTDGWEHGSHAVAEDWCRRINAFFKAHDPYGRATTGTQSGAVRQWWAGGYAIFDIAARELYEAQGHPMPGAAGQAGPEEHSPLWYSAHNYAAQAQRLWREFEKPAIIGECGFDHTYDEPGTPGYIAMHHNALWVGLANGLCCTPFWWSASDRLNDSIATNQLLFFRQFVADLDCTRQTYRPATVRANAAEGWAMLGERDLFGWVVNPAGIAGATFTVEGVPDGRYDVRVYRTWRGEYLPAERSTVRDGRLTVHVPQVRMTDGHANNLGADVAFRAIRIEPAPPAR